MKRARTTIADSLVAMLSGGDRRSIGRADEVAALVLCDSSRVGELIDAISHVDAVVRMRAADATEKLSRTAPQLLLPFKRQLLGPIAKQEQQEVKWHFAQVVARLSLSQRERTSVVKRLTTFLNDPSNIVRVCALQALCDLSITAPELVPMVTAIAQQQIQNGSPSVAARSRKLLKQLSSRPYKNR